MTLTMAPASPGQATAWKKLWAILLSPSEVVSPTSVGDAEAEGEVACGPAGHENSATALVPAEAASDG